MLFITSCFQKVMKNGHTVFWSSASPHGLAREAHAGTDLRPPGTPAGVGRAPALLQHPAFAPGFGLPDAAGSYGVKGG